VVTSFDRVIKSDIGATPVPAMQNARADGLHIPIALLRSISRLKATTKRAKIMANILSAAMYIAFLRSAASNGLDDLPETAQALMIQYGNSTPSQCPFLIISIHRSSTTSTTSQFTREDQEFLQVFDTKEAGLGGLRNPLHLAAAISPVCLLMPVNLAKKSFHRQTLIEVTICNS